MESIYNRSVKIMYGLPWATHRYLIEPLSGVLHLHKILVKRYLSFIQMIRNSGKQAIIQLLDIVQADVRLTTGWNLRTIMLDSGRNTLEELNSGYIEVKYHEIPDSEAWRITFIQEIVEVNHGELEVVGMSKEELEQIQEYLCTQ